MLKSALRVALGTGIFLLLPLYLTLTGSGVDGIGFHWTPGDFVFMFLIIFLPIFLFDQARKKWAGNGAYKTAAGLALLGSFLLLWVNGAVGIIGESDFNMLYVLVVFTLFIGSIVARGKPQGMSYTLFAAAFVQAIIPVIALVMKEPDFSPGVMRVFVLSAFWVMLFVGSGLLFRQASIPSQK